MIKSLLNFKLITFYLGVMLISFSFYLTYQGFLFYILSKVIFVEWELFTLFGSSLIVTFILDWMSLTFMGFVMFISGMIFIYSTYYMEGDMFIVRFITLVFLFVLSMLLVIASPNLISILLGWDGLGLVSYCLVIYYQNEKSANAGMLTILSNRIGDVALLLSISWLAIYGSWNFYFFQLVYTNVDLFFITFLIVLAGLTKSAQIPFSAWLPAAMAAPTPVSALVHSSTLVTAGVYLLIRFNVMLGVNNILFYLGSLTMFMSGLGANLEMDLKKIIALSTLSQLGVMMFTLSLGFYEFSFFHLLSHALFKSLLFLCAGVFIHSMGDIQDIRYLSGLNIGCPVSSFFFIACSLSLCGFPFLSGFYSKDLILESYLLSHTSLFMLLIVLIGTFFTATYSIRLMMFMFFKNLGGKINISLGEVSGMILPMSSLFMVSVFAGNFITLLYIPCCFVFLPLFFKMLILTGIIGLSYMVFINMSVINLFAFKNLKNKIHFMGTMWFMPILSTYFFMPSLALGSALLKYLDQGWVEIISGQGMFMVMRKSGSQIDYFFSLNIKSYLLMFLMILIFLFFY
uniref:NADH-ubiquinone oxidoreductase chain 5 n=1 Tax=Orchesella villosa TaxID=48706 RepID=B2BSD2_ORCVL|nr:NADH dehydrogenase subunit 5 [Orchesella villosa]ABS57585.1 NADH dehydrogenase subunit 5 [Orchesella villosa]